MNFSSLYRNKVVSAADAVSQIKSSSRVYLGGGAGVPIDLVHALTARHQELRNVDVLRLQNAAQQGQTQPLFKSGQAVQITQGPFAGLNAVYHMTDGESRAMVLIEILSKQCRLAVAPAHLLKAA